MNEVHKRPARKAVNGLFLLNKPAGLTSNQALQKVKRLLNARKGGHTGSLDPAATGMLPLCFGEATKVCAYLLDADKTYRVGALLGEATDTGDATGKVIRECDVPNLTADVWQSLLDGFRGASQQIPPMYSALKKDGKRLYELARQGQVVERAPRGIRIRHIELLEAHGRRVVFRVQCSKGTYVRTLVEDIAVRAGTVAHTAALHRESVAGFQAVEMLELGQVEQLAADGGEALEAALLPVDRALEGWPACQLPVDAGDRFCGGQPAAVTADGLARGTLVRVYDDARVFLGIGELTGDGRVAPRRVLRALPP